MVKVAPTEFRAALGAEYAGFLNLLYEHAADYLEPSLTLLGMDKSQFEQLFRTRGEVVTILSDGEIAGFYWVEERDETLHVHGLVVKPEFRKRGLAAAALRQIERQASDEITRLELGVHRSNGRARAIYEKAGYQVVRTLPEFEFSIMQKNRSW